MKRIGMMLLVLTVILSLAACSGASENVTVPQEEPVHTTENTSLPVVESETEHKNNILIAYFGRWGNTEFPDGVDASTSASIVLGKDNSLQGTTEYLAYLIQENIGGELHLIQTERPYPADYEATVDQNHKEQEEGIVPKLQSIVENMERYDTIFIGYPIWATTTPQPIVSFLSQYDFSGKTIIPFCTHAGYGSGDSYERIQELCPDAIFFDGLAIEAEEIGSADQSVAEWLSQMEITPDTK